MRRRATFSRNPRTPPRRRVTGNLAAVHERLVIFQDSIGHCGVDGAEFQRTVCSFARRKPISSSTLPRRRRVGVDLVLADRLPAHVLLDVSVAL